MLLLYYVSLGEMSQFQDRLSRCSMACQDEVRDRFSSSQDSAGAKREMGNCMSTCVDKHVALLKSVQTVLERDIDTIAKQM
ncbi:DUF842 domain-containing protein [archaeon]|nr:MAG: DUF842 domain-containing protein [archaeon]